MTENRQSRREAVSERKRELILDAARQVFAEEGLDGASLRAIAVRAGYTPAALYFHFDSKEAMYAEVLQTSLESLGAEVGSAVSHASSPHQKLKAAAMSFFQFYAANPRDLDLGFYLFRGGMKPAGLGQDRDLRLNAALEAALHPIAEAAVELGASRQQGNLLMVDCFAHAAGLLLLLHTGRIRMFGASAPELMETYVDSRVEQLGQGLRHADN
ncbi:TetR family transcriptional regulator [Paracoccus sp. M683]|uniref:TetR/AcrR family transcriptional regulator n=1 Tax=Paracoccus sp. M683 TaxID=2594268 RepID=UPI00117D1A55|nr:TetR/AcrR family transcriptional regulator [Paracoccus sp. M683]TRW94860.1 TetR family transcriptional regulator [Paracoccus sp. M683]